MVRICGKHSIVWRRWSTRRESRSFRAYLVAQKTLPADAIEKLINVREAAGYLGEGARCQACGYLHETQLACPTGDRPAVANYANLID